MSGRAVPVWHQTISEDPSTIAGRTVPGRPLTCLQLAVYDLVSEHVGRAQAARAQDICHRLQSTMGWIVDEREIREAVEVLRSRGEGICSSPGRPAGYFMPATKKEAEDCHQSLRDRITAQCVSAAGQSRGMKRLFPDSKQLELDLEQIIKEAQRYAQG